MKKSAYIFIVGFLFYILFYYLCIEMIKIVSILCILTLIILWLIDRFQTKHALRRNFPIIGRFRWVAESLRPKIVQYFVESDTDGKPFSRNQRSMVYQRAKGETDTIQFGTQNDLYQEGNEWVYHSMYPSKDLNYFINSHVIFGDINKANVSLINISAMSYGALSKTAILALGKGAKKGNFLFNTGEGGISKYHLESGANLIWQIGTGYFGCRNINGNFDLTKYSYNAQLPNVKMIELKLSQGAKPGHGGLLPAKKNTLEIAKIRGIEPHKDVHSPASHTAFTNNKELVDFIYNLKVFSVGKPVGIKLCMGRQDEFKNMIDSFHKNKIYPDFITIDGAEGGTGAAPAEFTNNIGMPLYEALTFTDDYLKSLGIRNKIKIIASGRVISGFDVVKLLALGADTVNIARGFMMSLGCIQALECNKDTCPTGIATQNKRLMKGIVPDEKYKRVYSYHKATLNSAIDIMNAMGLKNIKDLNRSMIFKRSYDGTIKSYEDIYPYQLIK